MTLNLTANGAEQAVIKEYLEQNASDILAEKINNGVAVEQDGKTLINRKTLDGFMRYAAEEARRQAEKGASCACVQDAVVFGWAIHYFEEESIIGTLYNEDGTEYQKPKFAPKAAQKKASGNTVATSTPAPVVSKTASKSPQGQMTMFDFFDDDTDTAADATEKPVAVIKTEPEAVATTVVKPPEKPPVLPLYEKYLQHQEEHPNTIIAMKVGDFYEIFGDSAKLVAEQLNMTLTSRDVGLESRVPMVGYPYHKADDYISKIRVFSRLAVIEQDGSTEVHPKIVPITYQVDVSTGELIDDIPVADEPKQADNADPYADMDLMMKIYELLDCKIDIVR